VANYGHQLFDVADNQSVNQFTALGSAVYRLYCLAESTYLHRIRIEHFKLGCINFQRDIVFPICSSPWFQNDMRGSSRWWVAVIQRRGTKRCRTLPPGVSCQEWPPTVYPTLNLYTVFIGLYTATSGASRLMLLAATHTTIISENRQTAVS